MPGPLNLGGGWVAAQEIGCQACQIGRKRVLKVVAVLLAAHGDAGVSEREHVQSVCEEVLLLGLETFAAGVGRVGFIELIGSDVEGVLVDVDQLDALAFGLQECSGSRGRHRRTG